MFSLDPETAHAMAARALALAGAVPLMPALFARALSHRDPALETEVAGLKFPNPVGLAAGFDKDCRLAAALPSLGFGFAELGTVTAFPQEGNPRPRIFRFPESQALINRLGFNNVGAERAARNLARLGPRPIPLGINLGINAEVSPEDAPDAYAKAFARLAIHGDYFTINVSSPNTSGLRRLQDKLRLERILTRIRDLNGDKKPVFVKLSPDLEDEALFDLLPTLEKLAAGVILTNTTSSRNGMPDEALHTGGGLSGAPLKDLSTRMIRAVYARTEGRLPIIGVGGIFGPEDAYQKIRAGASLVQIYTGLIYRGPGLPAEINRGLTQLLKQHGCARLSDAVGRSHPGIASRGPAR